MVSKLLPHWKAMEGTALPFLEKELGMSYKNEGRAGPFCWVILFYASRLSQPHDAGILEHPGLRTCKNQNLPSQKIIHVILELQELIMRRSVIECSKRLIGKDQTTLWQQPPHVFDMQAIDVVSRVIPLLTESASFFGVSTLFNESFACDQPLSLISFKNFIAPACLWSADFLSHCAASWRVLFWGNIPTQDQIEPPDLLVQPFQSETLSSLQRRPLRHILHFLALPFPHRGREAAASFTRFSASPLLIALKGKAVVKNVRKNNIALRFLFFFI